MDNTWCPPINVPLFRAAYSRTIRLKILDTLIKR